jgi:hypothetical protein
MLKFLTSFFKAKPVAPTAKTPYKVEALAVDKPWDFPAPKKSTKKSAVKKTDKPIVKAAAKSRAKSKKPGSK